MKYSKVTSIFIYYLICAQWLGKYIIIWQTKWRFESVTNENENRSALKIFEFDSFNFTVLKTMFVSLMTRHYFLSCHVLFVPALPCLLCVLCGVWNCPAPPRHFYSEPEMIWSWLSFSPSPNLHLPLSSHFISCVCDVNLFSAKYSLVLQKQNYLKSSMKRARDREESPDNLPDENQSNPENDEVRIV